MRHGRGAGMHPLPLGPWSTIKLIRAIIELDGPAMTTARGCAILTGGVNGLISPPRSLVTHLLSDTRWAGSIVVSPHRDDEDAHVIILVPWDPSLAADRARDAISAATSSVAAPWRTWTSW